MRRERYRGCISSPKIRYGWTFIIYFWAWGGYCFQEGPAILHGIVYCLPGGPALLHFSIKIYSFPQISTNFHKFVEIPNFLIKFVFFIEIDVPEEADG